MIYDGHVYCFPDLRGNAGWTDRGEYMRHLHARRRLPSPARLPRR